MIIILKADATAQEQDQLISQIEAAGLQAHLSEGTYRTILGVIGDETLVNADQLRAAAGVADVLPVLPPYKLARLYLCENVCELVAFRVDSCRIVRWSN